MVHSFRLFVELWCNASVKQQNNDASNNKWNERLENWDKERRQTLKNRQTKGTKKHNDQKRDKTKKKGKRRKTKRITQANNAALPTSLTSGPAECAHALSNWFRICSRNTICQKLSFGYFVKKKNGP